MNTATHIAGTLSPDRVTRRLWLVEREEWRDHLLRLTPQDRRMRFAGVVHDEFIQRYCDSADFFSTRLVGCFVDGTLRGVGEFRRFGGDGLHAAELAFSVEEGFQGQGIGTELFQRLIVAARNRGVQRVFIVSEQGNERMRRIARKFGMDMGSGYGELEGRLELHWPSYASVMEEMLQEGAALFHALPAAYALSREAAAKDA